MEPFPEKWKMESLQFCKKEFYESFRAPKWTDLSKLYDTTWFCTFAGCNQNHFCFEEMPEQTISLKDPSPSSANGFNKSTQKAKTASSKSRTTSPSSSSSTNEKFRTPMKTGSQIGSARKCLKFPENENPNHRSNLNVPKPKATPLKDSLGDSQNPSDSPANLLNTTNLSSKSRKALSTLKTKTSAPSATERKAPRCMKDEFPLTEKYQRNTNNHCKNGHGQLKTPLIVPVKKGFCELKTAQVKERTLLKGSSRCPLTASSSPSSAEANMKGNSVAPSGPSPCIKLNFAGLDGGNKACPQTKDQGRNEEFKQEDVDKRHNNPRIDMQKLELAEESEEQDAWKENIVEVETFTDSLADLRTEENKSISKMTTQSSPNNIRKKTNNMCPKPFRFRTEERRLAREANLQATAISQTPTHLPQSKSPSKLKMVSPNIKKSISKMTTQSSPNKIRKKTNITCPKPFRFRTKERRLASEANLQATAISQTSTHLPQSKSPSKLKMVSPNTTKSISKMTTQSSPNKIRKKTNIICPKPFRFRIEERRFAREANLQATTISQTPTHLPQSKSPSKLKMSKEKLAQAESSPSKSKALGSLSKGPLSHNQRRISGLPKFYAKMKMDKLSSSVPVHPNHGARPLPKDQTSSAHHQNNTPFFHSLSNSEIYEQNNIPKEAKLASRAYQGLH